MTFKALGMDRRLEPVYVLVGVGSKIRSLIHCCGKMMTPRIVPESFIRPSPRRGGRSQKGLCRSYFSAQ